jgi:peptidyl-tRNA hydrolase, PTH2 family
MPLGSESEAEPVMYFVVNKSLQMGKGKIAAQVAHGAIALYRDHPQTTLFCSWERSGHTKIVLAADQTTMESLSRKYPETTRKVIDQGRTQVVENSFSVLAFQVMVSGSNPDLTALKLL